MDIALPDLNRAGRKAMFVAGRSRAASATSVRFLDSRTLCCASLIGECLYLIDFDWPSGSYRVLDTIDTTFEGRLTETDLMDADADGNVFTSNFYRGSASHYRREGDRFAFVRDLPLAINGDVHGIGLVAPDVLAVTVSGGRAPRGLYFFERENCRPIFAFGIDCATKDICPIGAGRVAVGLAYGTPKRDAQPVYASELRIYDLDVGRKTCGLVAAARVDGCHCDSIAFHDGRIVMNDSMNDRILLFEPETLGVVAEMQGFDFPHGIAARDGLLAVTNYGSNTVSLRKLPENRPPRRRKRRARFVDWRSADAHDFL